MNSSKKRVHAGNLSDKKDVHKKLNNISKKSNMMLIDRNEQ